MIFRNESPSFVNGRFSCAAIVFDLTLQVLFKLQWIMVFAVARLVQGYFNDVVLSDSVCEKVVFVKNPKEIRLAASPKTGDYLDHAVSPAGNQPLQEHVTLYLHIVPS